MASPLRYFAIALTALAIIRPVVAQEAALPKSTFFEEAKITVNARAHADGYMRVRVTPENGAPREATIAVLRRMNENDIAKQLAETLRPALAPDYKVDRDAGEHVKIGRASKTTPNFSVEVTFSSPGFSIILEN
jgi:hypothetical protein